MSWNIVTIREGSDIGEDALYPLVGAVDSQYVVDIDGRDGQVSVVQAKGLKVQELRGDKLVQVAKAADVKIDLYLTETRIAIGCEKYDEGGRYWGFGAGAILALAANGISMAVAAVRRRNKALVGHIRYPWLYAVGASSKTGWTDEEMLRLRCYQRVNGVQRTLYLDLTLPKSVSAVWVAQQLMQRSARYRLQHDPSMEPSERAAFEGLAHAPPLVPEPKKFALYDVPTAFPVMSTTAFPSVAEPSALAAAPRRPALRDSLDAATALRDIEVTRPRVSHGLATLASAPVVLPPPASHRAAPHESAPRACGTPGCPSGGRPVTHKFCGDCGSRVA